MRRAMHSVTETDEFGSSYRALPNLSNAGLWTMARLQQTFGRDAASRSSTNWSKVSVDALTSGLDKGDPSRY